MSQGSETPQHRYTAALAGRIEAKWQELWEEQGTYEVANPVGDLSKGWNAVADRPKQFIMDMFPYPSGAGLHVGHPLGYIATDVYGRYLRMTGHNVLHTIGYDAFGLPAEQYAVEHNQHPRVTTEANIRTMRAQLKRLGLAHDQRRSIETIDPSYVRWTQWIFLQLFNSWYDAEVERARPIDELRDLFASGQRPLTDGRRWADLSEVEQRGVLDDHRLAYRSSEPVNWCPGLGTVLANEEVTAEGRSERGNFPVFRRPLTQWMLRITAYADRLIGDLDLVDWPEPVRLMQRNWIGRSVGARVRFPFTDVNGVEGDIEVFTTRPDTLCGATYMVLAPEHPLVDRLTMAEYAPGTPEAWKGGDLHQDASSPAAVVKAYRAKVERMSDQDRTLDTKEKTGVAIGGVATNPTTGQQIPVFIADYVMMGYGTGAIMAVPAHDTRDFEFARAFEIPMVKVVQAPDGSPWAGDIETWDSAYVDNQAGVATNSAGIGIDGLLTDEAKAGAISWLEERGLGAGTVQYKLRDWLFSRQRYWGEPFPIVYDEHNLPIAVPTELLPVYLPEMDDFSPATRDPEDPSDPEPPLGRNKEWTAVELDLGEGRKTYRRELNTMPNWAGSCWYYLRYIDPTSEDAAADDANQEYWGSGTDPRTGEPAAGMVDLYVGGVEHAVLHLLYSRFWHKVLFDLGHVPTPEPFQKLINQGYILAYVYRDERGMPVPAAEVEERDGQFFYEGQPVTQELGKIGKSLKNAVSPEEMYEAYGADTLRLYEMSMGPLEMSRPWSTTDVIGSHRLLQRLWRTIVEEDTGTLKVVDMPADTETRQAAARAIHGVRADFEAMRFNTAVAKITGLVNHVTKNGRCERDTACTLVTLIAPLAPHIAEELWSRLGNTGSVAYAAFPEADPELLVQATVTMVVQVNGKVKDRLDVAPDISEEAAQKLALASEKVQAAMAGQHVRKSVVRAPKLVNLVVG